MRTAKTLIRLGGCFVGFVMSRLKYVLLIFERLYFFAISVRPWAGLAGPGTSVGCASDMYSGGRGFDPSVRQHCFVEIGHEIISTAILSQLLIEVGQLSVSSERMCTKYWLTA